MKKEHFWVCLGTFNLDLSFQEMLSLFDYLDTSRDGLLDEREFVDSIFPSGFNSVTNAVYDANANQATTKGFFYNEDLASVVTHKTTHSRFTSATTAPPKFQKRPMNEDEMLDLPYFFRMKVNNLSLNQGKMVGLQKPKRALSIVSSTPKEGGN